MSPEQSELTVHEAIQQLVSTIKRSESDSMQSKRLRHTGAICTVHRCDMLGQMESIENAILLDYNEDETGNLCWADANTKSGIGFGIQIPIRNTENSNQTGWTFEIPDGLATRLYRLSYGHSIPEVSGSRAQFSPAGDKGSKTSCLLDGV